MLGCIVPIPVGDDRSFLEAFGRPQGATKTISPEHMVKPAVVQPSS
jgi:hypothetical protein